MFRTILPDGEIGCAAYNQTDKGVELFTEDNELIAFVPYSNLVAVINEQVYDTEERSIM